MKNIEIAYLLVAYSMGYVIYHKNRAKSFLTVSETAAGSKGGYLSFSLGLLLSGILFELLMFEWFIPHYGFGHLFKVLVVVLFVFQVLAGVIPARNKLPKATHLTAAFGLEVSMILLVTAISLHQSFHAYIRLTSTVLALVMASLLAATYKLSPTKYFRQQSTFFACWHIALFAAVYFG